MKLIKKTLQIVGIIVCSLFFVSALVIGIWYVSYDPTSYDSYNLPYDNFNRKKYFDLCVADEFCKNRANQQYDSRTNKRIQVTWNIPIEQFWNCDTINFSFTNTTDEKLYYLGFQHPYYCFLTDYIIAPMGKLDTLYNRENEGFDDGFRGSDIVEYIPFKKKASITLSGYNPILVYPTFDNCLPMNNEDFPKIIKKIYGDTAQIRYGVYLRGLPWNDKGFAVAYSDFMKIPIDSVIAGWAKNRFAKYGSSDPEIYQDYIEYLKINREKK